MFIVTNYFKYDLDDYLQCRPGTEKFSKPIE